jgi:hypothetical protein
MFDLFKKNKPEPEPKPEPIIEKSKYAEEFEQDVAALKVKLVDIFLKEEPPLSLVSETMKKEAISCLLKNVITEVKESIKIGKREFMLVSAHLYEAKTIPEKHRKIVFKSVVNDLKLILDAKGMKTEVTGKPTDATMAITIKIDDLKKFSNYEKLGALK